MIQGQIIVNVINRKFHYIITPGLIKGVIKGIYKLNGVLWFFKQGIFSNIRRISLLQEFFTTQRRQQYQSPEPAGIYLFNFHIFNFFIVLKCYI